MVICEHHVADLKRRLSAGKGDAILIVDANAPEGGPPLGLATELFAAEARHGLQAGDGDSVMRMRSLRKALS